jgi:hypothetical protein
MQNLPIEFKVTDVRDDITLHLSYNFDMISSIDFNEGNTLGINQSFPIQALEISLAGRTSNPNISVSINSVTRLFTLNAVYITDTYPHMVDDTLKKCFVIEGYSNENVSKERVLIFLPMNPSTTTQNLFYPLETAIVNENKNVQLNLNQFIPSADIEQDYYQYYTHTDDSGVLFHVVFFTHSYLGYSGTLTIPTNPTGYTSGEVDIVSKSKALALHHTNMNNQFEDNIYIDCVPVDVINQEKEKYMQMNISNATYMTDMLVILSYMIALSLIVYGIYYFYIYVSRPAKEGNS